jgi:hypothetical protein
MRTVLVLAWDVPVGELARKLVPVSRADLEREHQTQGEALRSTITSF